MQAGGARSEAEMIDIQRQLALQLRFPPIDPASVRRIAGADTAYWTRGGAEYGACCVVVLDARTHEVLEVQTASGPVTTPYIPGLLAFRELPLFLDAYNKLRCLPDAVMFDGNGYLHPRHMGIAAQAHFSIGKPTFGVAKTYYNYAQIPFPMPEDRLGACADIVIDGEICGRVLRGRAGAKPVFVSAGGGIDLDSATAITRALLSPDSRVPIPTRLADLETKRQRRRLLYAE